MQYRAKAGRPSFDDIRLHDAVNDVLAEVHKLNKQYAQLAADARESGEGHVISVKENNGIIAGLVKALDLCDKAAAYMADE